MAIAIETSGLTKYYGSSPGIIDLNLSVVQGEVFGFIGLDIIEDTLEIRRRVGYLPGDLSMYDSMTAREFLMYFANLRKCECTASMTSLADRFQLELDRRIKDYSTGNRQKVGIVNAFMHRPELLILDEPTAGLDPLMQQEFQELINEVRTAGCTVFLSSHILPEVDRVADRVGIVRESRLIAVDTVEAFKARAHSTISIQFASPVDDAVFTRIEGVKGTEVRNGGTVLTVTVSGSLDAVIKETANHDVVSISTRDSELEEVFLSYYAGDTDVP